MYGYREGNSVPRAEAVIRGKSYRFTVLTPSLIRMEYSRDGVFADCATQTVVNRDFPLPEFQVEETEEELSIVTERLRLKYNKKEFSPAGLCIRLTGRFHAFSSVWNYGDRPNDLKGTARTLDQADGSIPLEGGILSAEGWTLLDDGGSLLVAESGRIEQRKDTSASDLYFFGYGRDYMGCLKDFYRLTGKVPLLPRYAFGNWWSRYYRYSEESYLALMDRFSEEDIPFTVAVIDMDWHLTDVAPEYGAGWTGYTWNTELFPDPVRFLRELHGRNLKVTLNVHPADGVQAYEDCYPAFAEYMGVNAAAREPVLFEPGDPKFMEGYFSCVHHPLEEQGVDFWWIDWQQGTNSGVEGLDPLWILNHCHYLDNCRGGKRGLIFSRYAGPGSHRYPVGFSGDTVISWKSLAFQPYFTANASNIGYGWWSHDIGGHMDGIKDDELAVRWLQLGVFSPVLRLHSTNNEFNGKEPWRYNRIAEAVMKDFLRLRHRLIPYLYTMNLRACEEGVPLVQPVYYHHPFEAEAYQVPNEYYFGSQLLVCPMTEQADRESGMAGFGAWLPEGVWTDVFTGMRYEGGRRVDFYREIDKIPVLLKSGGILPLDGRTQGNAYDLPEYLELCLAPGAGEAGEFCLWEDDGVAVEYDAKNWAVTTFCWEPGEVLTFTIQAVRGNASIVPPARKYRLSILGMEAGIEPAVYAGDVQVAGVTCSYQEETGRTVVEIPETETGKTVTVRLHGAVPHKNGKTERIFAFLNRAQMEFNVKTRIYNVVRQLDEGKSLLFVVAQLQGMELRREILGPVMEVLLSCE